MTVAALASSITYIENGVTSSFAVPYRFKPGSLVVERIAASGVVATLAIGVNYSVTGGATDAGGTVMVPVASTGTKLHIRRRTPRSQAADYTTGDRFPAELTEGVADTAMLIDQEQDDTLAELDTRALKVPAGVIAPIVPAPVNNPGKFLTALPGGGVGWSIGTGGGDAALRGDLASAAGAGFSGFRQRGLVAVGSVEQKLWEGVSILDAVAGANRAAVQDGAMDCSAAMKEVIAYFATTGRGGCLHLPDGDFKYASSAGGMTIGADRLVVRGNGRDVTRLTVIGAAAIPLFSAINKSKVSFEDFSAIGNGVQGGFGSGNFLNAYLKADSATGDMTDWSFRNMAYDNFASARWIDFIHYGKLVGGVDTYDAAYAIRRITFDGSDYQSREGNCYLPSNLGANSTFIDVNGYRGPIKGVHYGDRNMDARYIKQCVLNYGDIEGITVDIDRMIDAGVFIAEPNSSSYAWMLYQTSMPGGAVYGPRKVQGRIGSIERPYSCGLYVTGARDVRLDIGHIYGQIDTDNGTLPKAALASNTSRDIYINVGKCDDNAFDVDIAGLGGYNGEAVPNPPTESNIHVNLHSMNTKQPVFIRQPYDQPVAGGVKITGTIARKTPLANSKAIQLLPNVNFALDNIDIDVDSYGFDYGVHCGSQPGVVVLTNLSVKGKWRSRVMDFYGDANGGGVWAGINLDIVSTYVAGKSFAIYGRAIKGFRPRAELRGYVAAPALSLHLCQGVLPMDAFKWVGSTNRVDVSGVPLGVVIPTWAGNFGDFVTSLNYPEPATGAAGARAVSHRAES